MMRISLVHLLWRFLWAEHSSIWVYQSPRSPKIRNVEDSSFVSSLFNHAFKEPKIQVRADPVWLTHKDKVRGSNNQAPWATLKMTELVCCIYLYQWCYLCAEHSSFWVYQSLSSPKIRNVEDSSFVSSPFDYAFKEPMIQVCADPKCETHTHR